MNLDDLKYKNDNDVAEVFTDFQEQIKRLKGLIEMHKGVSSGKSIIIKELEKLKGDKYELLQSLTVLKVENNKLKEQLKECRKQYLQETLTKWA